MIIALVSNGPYKVLVAGMSYGEIVQRGEGWIRHRAIENRLPDIRTEYLDLSCLTDQGVLGELDVKHADVAVWA